MKNYITITNEYFEILIPLSLKEYGEEVLNYSTDKVKEFLSFFREQNCEKIKGAFLINHDDFINRIKEVSFPNSSLPPKWATGCFYGGETERIVWLDESLANNFDGSTDKLIKDGTFKNIIIKLINNNKLPNMNELSFSKGNIITKEYNGYDLFKVVGRYLIETRSDLLDYINNKERIINDGKKILEESLDYFISKYNLK